MTKNGKNHTALKILFIAYVCTMMYLLFFGRMSSYTALTYDEYVKLYTNFVPLKTLKLFYSLFRDGASYDLMKAAFVNLAGNVVMFVPVGLILPGIWKKQRKLWIFLPTTAIAVALIEGMQLVFMLGSCDVDDFILNMVGILLGFMFWKLFSRKK